MKPCLGIMKPALPLLTALLLGPLASVLPAADAGANGAAPPEILAPDEQAFVRELATATLTTTTEGAWTLVSVPALNPWGILLVEKLP